MDVEREIRSFIRENFILDGEGPGPDESLSAAAILDSMGVLELIMFVEERYEVEVPDEDAVPANFDTISRIARYVTERRATEGGADDLPAAYRVA